MESQFRLLHISVSIYRMGRSLAPLGGGFHQVILMGGGLPGWELKDGVGDVEVINKELVFPFAFTHCDLQYLLWGVHLYERLHEA